MIAQPRLPSSVRETVAVAWGRKLHREVRIAGADRVSGGCISPVVRLESDAGDVAFLKWGEGDHAADMFVAEAHALRTLASTDTVRVPAVLAASDDAVAEAEPDDAVGPPWLLLEWLEPGTADVGVWRGLGATLARLHHVRAARWGWDRDNFIGSLPQSNRMQEDWAAFWREQRLEPQLRLARDGGRLDDVDARRFDALFAHLDELLAAAREDGPSLLHGDLWSGNVHVIHGNGGAVIDPASYHGHREVDLAMTELFGGFDPVFYAAYEDAWKLQPGYREHRRSIYQLYYLLVHVNLFGGGYAGSTRAALERAGF